MIAPTISKTQQAAVTGAITGAMSTPDVADDVVAALSERGVPSWVAGTVQRRDGDGPAARLESTYR